jgi:hypothetical protein
MKLIKNSERVTEVTYEAVFDSLEMNGCAYSFPCTWDGQIYPLKNELAEANLQKLLTDGMGGTYTSKPEVRTWKHSYTIAAQWRCDCGAIVYIAGRDETCERCGADYNASGQRLAPRSQWGEETGETYGDIVMGRCGDGWGN